MGGVVVDMVPSNSPGILDPANHGNRGDRPRKGVFCPKEGAGWGCREIQINIVIFKGIKYAKQMHELLYPIS